MKTVFGYLVAAIVSVILTVGSYGIFGVPLLVAWTWWISNSPKAWANGYAEA